MTIKQIEAVLEEGQSLKSIAQAFSEIASLKVKRIRNEVERNRLFFDEIAKVYGMVKAFAIKKGVFLSKSKQKLYILITSNYKFYGNINWSLIKYFIGLSEQLTDVDIVILGKGGIDHFRAARILTNYQEVVLEGDMPNSFELNNLIKLMKDYNQVLVFHTQFKSLLKQSATFTDLTAMSYYLKTTHIADAALGKGENFMQFIFEPELPKILNFFETQILTLLFEQTFLESELSRAASRFISMDQAETKANQFIKEYQAVKAYAKDNLINNAVLENYAALAAIRKKTV